MRSCKISRFILLLMLLYLSPASASDSLQAKNVLLLFSLEPGLPAYDLIYANLRATLDKQTNEPINYYIEYLDCSRFPNEEYQRQLFSLYSKKYSAKKLDVCVAVSQGIESMLEKYGKGLFAGVPTIFIEFPSLPGQAPPYFRKPHTTGILMGLDLKKNLETALSLYPGAANVYIVTGASPTDQFFLAMAKNAFGPYEDTFKISYLQGMPMDELLQTVGNFSKDSLIIYMSYLRDAVGRVYYPAHALKLISDKANVPVFGMSDTYIGYGIVGGYMLSFERVGIEAGKMVLRVLRGEPPETLPVVREGMNLFMFDWRQLKRWKISENRWPAKSEIRFYTPTFWQANRLYILGILLLCVIESLLIAGLLFQRRQKRIAMRELQESEARMRMAASAAELALWVWDIHKDEIWLTPKGRTMFGFSDSEPINSMRFLEVMADEDRKSIRQFLKFALESGREYEIEHRIVMQSGDSQWIMTRGQADVDENKRPLRMRGVSADISKRKKAEEETARLRDEISRLSRINMLNELSGALAHELNQPLAAILSTAQAGIRFLNSGTANSELLSSIFQNIVEDDKRAAEVITSLRSMVKKEKSEKKPVHLNDILNDVLKIYSSEAAALNLKIETDLAESLPLCIGDKVHLRQVVLNLIMNATDVMSLALPENKKMILRTKVAEHGVQVSVWDFGLGISDINKNQIFEPFFTTKTTGLGIGLALCKTIIKEHGGRIWAENNPDGGATFTFELPVMKND
jgi:PAS domain S-box-containing protein